LNCAASAGYRSIPIEANVDAAAATKTLREAIRFGSLQIRLNLGITSAFQRGNLCAQTLKLALQRCVAPCLQPSSEILRVRDGDEECSQIVLHSRRLRR